MKSKERVLRALEFRGPDRLPIGKQHLSSTGLLEAIKVSLCYPNDIAYTKFFSKRKKVGKDLYKDNWGVLWHSVKDKGQAIQSSLSEWDMLDSLKMPDYFNKTNFFVAKASRKIWKNKFLLGSLSDMIFSRMHYLRGYVHFMEDLYLEQDNIIKLLDLLVQHNIRIINKYADFGLDGVIGADDLGLQDRLMINPEMWREIFKPAYKQMIDAAHLRGMKFVLHSCGYIIDIIEDFIEIGLDSLQCDQQDNMGVDELNKRFGGRITFFSPVDIQTVLSTNDYDKITSKTLYLKATLGAHNGGLIGKVYPTPKNIGASEKSVRVMLDAFLKK